MKDYVLNRIQAMEKHNQALNLIDPIKNSLIQISKKYCKQINLLIWLPPIYIMLISS